jgi:hypothetical protein
MAEAVEQGLSHGRRLIPALPRPGNAVVLLTDTTFR